MIHADLWLAGVVFIFYLWECVRFLKPNEVAYTGVFTVTTRKWERSPLSYLLAGRHLCFINPIRVGAGIVVIDENKPASRSLYPDRAFGAAMRLSRPARRTLSFLCSVLALILFVALPVIVYRQVLVLLWRPLLVEFLALHCSIVIVFAMELRRWQRDVTARTSKILVILFNPAVAIRCIDVLSQTMFDALGERSGQTSKRR